MGVFYRPAGLHHSHYYISYNHEQDALLQEIKLGNCLIFSYSPILKFLQLCLCGWGLSWVRSAWLSTSSRRLFPWLPASLWTQFVAFIKLYFYCHSLAPQQSGVVSECTTLHFTLEHFSALHFIVELYIALHFPVLYITVEHYISLHFTTLHCTSLH